MKNGPEDRDGTTGPPVPQSADATLEARLRESLRPVALPPGFAERVLAAARAQAETSAEAPVLQSAEPAGTGAKVLPFHRRSAGLRLVAGGLLAASVLAGTFGVELERRHRDASREAARERATANQQFEEASRITDEALAHTRRQLERAGVFDDQGR